MEVRWLLLQLRTSLLLLSLVVGSVSSQGVYTNSWAVHVRGGKEEAQRIADKHNFINHGNLQCTGETSHSMSEYSSSE